MSLEDEVRGIIADQLAKKAEDVTPASTFASLGADSLDRVEIAMRLEEKYEIQIDDAEPLETVGKVISYVQSHYKVPKEAVYGGPVQ